MLSSEKPRFLMLLQLNSQHPFPSQTQQLLQRAATAASCKAVASAIPDEHRPSSISVGLQLTPPPPAMALDQWLCLCTQHSVHVSMGPDFCMTLRHPPSHTCKTIQMREQHRSDRVILQWDLSTSCTLWGTPCLPQGETSILVHCLACSFLSFLKHVLRLLLKHRNTEQLKTSTNFAFPSDLFTASSKDPLAHFGCLKRKDNLKNKKEEKRARKTLDRGKP